MAITPWHNAAAYEAVEVDTKQAEAKYECILIPQTAGANDFEVSFRIGDRSFSWQNIDVVELVADTEYNLTLHVEKDVFTVEGFTAKPWTEVDIQDIETFKTD